MLLLRTAAPCRDERDEIDERRDAPLPETLTRDEARFEFGGIEPARVLGRVVQHEAAPQPPPLKLSEHGLDRVVEVSEEIERQVPPEYAELLGITTLVCTPLSAAGRAYGVICADRGGGRFELSDGERHLLWTLGKTAALRDKELIDRLVDRHADGMAVAVDARNGMVATAGWTETSEVKASDLARALAIQGVPTLIYTNVSVDGTLQVALERLGRRSGQHVSGPVLL